MHVKRLEYEAFVGLMYGKYTKYLDEVWIQYIKWLCKARKNILYKYYTF